MVAMHTCDHPEFGSLVSAHCKKSCAQCSNECANTTTAVVDDDDSTVSGPG